MGAFFYNYGAMNTNKKSPEYNSELLYLILK